MSELKKIVKGSIFVFISFAVASVFGYLSKILLARQLGPSEFGIFTLSLTVVYIFTSFAIAGVGTSITYYISKEKSRDKRNVFFSTLFMLSSLSLVIFAVVILSLPSLIAKIFGNQGLMSLTYAIAGFTFLYGITRVIYSILRGEEKSKMFAILYATTPVIYFIAVFVLRISSASNALLYYVITYLLVDLFLFPYILKDIHFVKPNFNLIKQVFSFSIVLFLVEILFSLRRWTDVWMLSLLSTVSNIGYYNVAAMSAFAFNMVLMSMNFLYLPVANRLFNEKRMVHLREVYNKICFILTLIVSPFAIALTILAPEFISLIFGKVYLPSVVPFSILIVATLINVMFGPNWSNLIIKQEKKLLLSFALSALVLNAILNYLTIPIFGMIGAAISTATSIIFWNVLTTIAISKRMKMTPFSRNMFKSIAIAVIIGLPIVTIQKIFGQMSIKLSILTGIIYLGVYAGMIDVFVIKLKEITKFVFSLR